MKKKVFRERYYGENTLISEATKKVWNEKAKVILIPKRKKKSDK